MSTSTIQTGNNALLATIGQIFADNIYLILGVAVLLIGAGWVWGRFRKHVAGKKI